MTTIDVEKVAFITETSITIRESRRRTTVPKEIVDTLNLEDGDRIRWYLFHDQRILITKVHSKPLKKE